MAKKRRRRIVILAFFLLFVAVSIFAFRGLYLATQDDLPSTFELTDEYFDLIGEKYRDSVSVNEIIQSKITNPIALLTYAADMIW
jgi:hypothetical protein